MFRYIEIDKFIDMLSDIGLYCEEVVLRCFEALEILASAPPYQMPNSNTSK